MSAPSNAAPTPIQIDPVASATAAAPDSSTPTTESSLKRKVDAEKESAAASGSSSAPARGGRGGGGGAGNKRGRGGGSGGRGGRGGGGGAGYNRTEGAADDAEADAGASSTAAFAAAAAASSVPLTPLQQQFQLYASYLDQRNDRRELVFVASRELTRSSKKLISALQRCTHCTTEERAKLLAAARTQQLAELHKLVDATVSDLSEDETFRLSGAYSPGFQEFIEAASFLYYLEQTNDPNTREDEQSNALLTHAQLEADIAATLGKRVVIPISDYIVGITDLGGELMRYATNSVTADRSCIGRICTFLRLVYAEFQALTSRLPPGGGGGPYKEMGKKMETWMQSLVKIETLAYRLHIRGAEMPANMLSALLVNEARGGGGGGGYEDAGAGGGGGDDEQ